MGAGTGIQQPGPPHTAGTQSKESCSARSFWILECSRQQCLLPKLWPAHPSCRVCACPFPLPSKKLLLQFLKRDTASDPVAVVTLTTAVQGRGAHTAPQSPRPGAEAQPAGLREGSHHSQQIAMCPAPSLSCFLPHLTCGRASWVT